MGGVLSRLGFDLIQVDVSGIELPQVIWIPETVPQDGRYQMRRQHMVDINDS